MILVATKNGRTTNFFFTLSFVAVFGSELRDPGRTKIRIRNTGFFFTFLRYVSRSLVCVAGGWGGGEEELGHHTQQVQGGGGAPAQTAPGWVPAADHWVSLNISQTYHKKIPLRSLYCYGLKAIRYVLLGDTLNAFLLPRVFWICANLVWIRIRGSIPLTNGTGSCYFLIDLQDANKK